MTVLTTLVQISDLHFGDPALAAPSPLDAPTNDHLRRVRRADGYFGHTQTALEQLKKRIDRLRRDEHAKVVTTGDVTACGAPSQFMFAMNFFFGKAQISRRESLGLSMPDSLEVSIPGNHDHWPGDGSILGDPSEGLLQLWPVMPIVFLPIPLTANVQLLLCGINSDADTGSYSLGRLFARGHFRSQLDQLGRQLDTQQASQQVRAMLIHHSRLHRTSNHLEMMDGASRSALDEFLARHKIAIVLCGHVHKPRIAHWSTSYRNRPWRVWEIRCGTTTQRDMPPAKWGLSMQQTNDRFSPNSLIVHRLVADAQGAIYWRPTVELRTAAGFEPISHREWTDEKGIKVWPL